MPDTPVVVEPAMSLPKWEDGSAGVPSPEISMHSTQSAM